LNQRMEEIDHVTKSMYLYSGSQYGRLRDALIRDSGNKEEAIRSMTDVLLDIMSGIRNAVIVDAKDGKAYASYRPRARNMVESYDFLSEDWIAAAQQSPREMIVSSPHSEDYFAQARTEVITFCRAFLDMEELPAKDVVLGYLMIDYPYTMLDDVLTGYYREDYGRLVILDADGAEIWSAKEDRREFEDEVTVLSREIDAPGWTLQYQISRGLLLSHLNRVRRYALLLVLMAVVAAGALALLFSRRLTQPIHRLLEGMQKVRSGDLSARVNLAGADEMTQLGDGFNQMTEDLDTHIQRVYVARIRQREAELGQLKSQIQPHFLYNTLEVIRMNAITHNDSSTAEMTQALARQFKYSISEVRDLVPLTLEEEMMRNYLELISLRYENINYTSGIPNGLRDCRVVKLILQPVVENAVQHGLRPVGGGHISFSAEREEDDLVLVVMDDGRGMNEEELNAQRDLLESDLPGKPNDEGWNSIGLKNVHDRIRFICGDRYGIEITSRENVGTAVKIRMPILKGDERSENADG